MVRMWFISCIVMELKTASVWLLGAATRVSPLKKHARQLNRHTQRIIFIDCLGLCLFPAVCSIWRCHHTFTIMLTVVFALCV